ncbi:hypothetical protein SSX86_008328 [Deinandra increscens subsp. villosa]|uniref:Uncharacterized protein n=1 Tax=Deinandra increscens subsp. villosa TaxID=3103831 RepID=A0AAP0DFX7_9ASTR
MRVHPFSTLTVHSSIAKSVLQRSNPTAKLEHNPNLRNSTLIHRPIAFHREIHRSISFHPGAYSVSAGNLPISEKTLKKQERFQRNNNLKSKRGTNADIASWEHHRIHELVYLSPFEANCIDLKVPAKGVFSSKVKELEAEQFKPMDQVTLKPFERDHVSELKHQNEVDKEAKKEYVKTFTPEKLIAIKHEQSVKADDNGNELDFSAMNSTIFTYPLSKSNSLGSIYTESAAAGNQGSEDEGSKKLATSIVKELAGYASKVPGACLIRSKDDLARSALSANWNVRVMYDPGVQIDDII